MLAVGIDADDSKIELLLSEVKGKDITELIASGREKLASVPSGGAGAIAVAASGGGGAAAAAPAAAESKKEEKVEEKEESDDVSTSQNNNVYVTCVISWSSIAKSRGARIDLKSSFKEETNRCQSRLHFYWEERVLQKPKWS